LFWPYGYGKKKKKIASFKSSNLCHCLIVSLAKKRCWLQIQLETTIYANNSM
jgi:hypothetical protein